MISNLRTVPLLLLGSILAGCSSSPPRAAVVTPPRAIDEPDRIHTADHREVIRLHRANFSDDFILDRIGRERPAYSLSTEEVIELRNAGVSERVIEAMIESGSTTFRRELPRAGYESMSWEGVVRRNPGIRFGGRWSPGTLEIKDGQLRWMDARESEKNLLIPQSAIAEQFRTCLKAPGGNPCFEWGFRTLGGEEYIFRDMRWEQGVNDKVYEIHDYFESRFPTLIDSDRPVDDR